MMALWKKKKSSVASIGSSVNGSNLWIEKSDTYDGAFGSAPDPEYDEEVGSISISQNYMIHASLEIHTQVPVDNLSQMIKILDNLVDEYDGSFLGKPIIVIIYMILGTHLMQQRSHSPRSNLYKNAFVESISFSHDVNLILPTKGISYDKYIHCFHKGEPATISYHITINKTKRNGKNFMEAYYLKLPNGLVPPNPKNILKCYGIEIKDINGSPALFLLPD
ncbi:matrix protein [Porcine ephemerovirus 1]|uniref:Matrix protein n=1 Tax=Porcine ephemerovirus 1 TaxID=2928256 RepID=A0AAX3A6X0_9RHAB|nr:matrix protein [Porcine ephemerovirus 1]UNP42109.1 matrix protein [Porcine ephemerovirus 1]